MLNIVKGYYADQTLTTAFTTQAQQPIAVRPCSLAYLTAFNKSASTVYIALWDGAIGDGTPRILPCAAGAVVGWAELKMKNGWTVSATTTSDGDPNNEITTDDVKFDIGWLDEIV